MTSDADPSTRRQRLGAILARVVVPVWIVLGASFKLVDHTPKNLPRSLLDLAGSLGLGAHLDAWLALLIAGEGVAIAVMVFMGRWARPMAIFMLGCFCLILLNELRLGNFTDCGCFGNVPVPPWATLLVDGSLLVGVLACAPGVRPGDLRTSVPIHSEGGGPRADATVRVGSTAGLVPAAVVAVAVAVLAVAVIRPGGTPQPDGGDGPPRPATYLSDVGPWEGVAARDIDLLQWVEGWPESLSSGRAYVILYSRTCEHCHELLMDHFSLGAPVPTLLVAIPESTRGFAEEGVLPNPCPDCMELDLPTGTEWVITPPIVLALEDGVVVCAVEGEDPHAPACLPWHR